MLPARIKRVLTSFLLSAACVASARAADFNIVVNGKLVDTGGVAPGVINGHLLVPLAVIGNSMGAYMEWRPSTRSVYGRQNMNEFLLPIGSSTATVNGRIQTLEAPASIIRGRTMVPLRFVATALGAEVKFEGSTKTVYITSEGGAAAGGVTNPPATGSVAIDRFYVTPAEPLNAGDTFTVTMNGTAGGTATFDYGTQKNIPMTEVTPGVYTKTVQVPANAAFGRNVVTGRLAANGANREVQAGERVVVDTQAPLIKALRPANGAKVETDQPYISAELDDRGQSGVDTDSVKMVVNGNDVTSQANVTSDSVVYRGTLPTGSNTVSVTAADQAGNTAKAEWTFTVSEKQSAAAPAPPVILSPKDGEEVSGELTIRGTAEPGSTVRVRTTYSGTVLVILSQEGEANTQEVKAGSDGKWQAQAFTLPAPAGLKNIKYTISATATNSKGLSSEPTQVTVSRR